MSFGGFGDFGNTIGEELAKGLRNSKIGVIADHTFDKIGNSLKKALKTGEKEIEAWNKTITKIKKSKFGEIISNQIDMIKTSFQIGLDVFGVLMQLADAMGILKPLLDALNLVFSIMGAAAMEILVPALERLFEFLTDEDTMTFLKELGKTVGLFFAFIIDAIVQLLSDPNVRKTIFFFLSIITTFLTILFQIISWFVTMLAGLPLPAMVAIFALIAGIAGFWWGMQFGPIGAVIFGIAAAVGAGVIAGIAASQANTFALAEGGIITRPVTALVGEAGTEAVVPLDRADEFGLGNNQELIWAMEENNRRQEMIIMELRNIRKDNRRRR